jgi:hypothetical protein
VTDFRLITDADMAAALAGLTPTGASALVVQATASQTADIVRALGSDATEYFAVRSTANTSVSGGLDVNNTNRAASNLPALTVTSTNTLSRALVVKGNNVIDTIHIQNSTGLVVARFDKSGRLNLKVNSAPTDTDIANGEAVFWVDNTVGAQKLMARVKDSAGTATSLTLGGTTVDSTDYLSAYNTAKAA